MVFNRLYKYDISRILYVFVCSFIVFGFSLLLGQGFGIQYFFILIYAFPVFFLKPTEKHLALTLFTYNSLCYIYYEFGDLTILQTVSFTPEMTLAIRLTILLLVMYFSFILFYTNYQILIKNEERLMQTNQELEKAHQIKQEFLATMSHELRTPLNAVVTISSLLDENPEHPDKTTFLKLLKHSSHNLLSIVNDILDFSKLEANKMKLEMTALDIRSTLKKIVETYSSLADEKGLKLVLDVEDEVGKTYKIDEVKLGQIIGNLISNAIKYTSSGEVTVRVEKYKNEGLFDELCFEVIDTGSGISADDLKNIFELDRKIKQIRFKA